MHSDTDERSIIIGPREQLFHLLAEASEIEHTLMCSYLYAAFILKTTDSAFSSAEAAAVKQWRNVILNVAIEEMSHLLLVANLSVAIGGRPHLNTVDQRISYDPPFGRAFTRAPSVMSLLGKTRT